MFTQVGDRAGRRQLIDFWTDVIARYDQSVASNTTVATDAELFFNMIPAMLYEFEAHIIFSSPAGAGTPDIKYTFNGPATLTGAYTSLACLFSTADAVSGAQGGVALATTVAIGTAATPRMVIVRGWAYSTAGGIGTGGFVFQWAQNTSGVNATVRLAGSVLRYRKMTQ